MQRIARFLKGALISTDPYRLPATAAETTLHDALRLCAAGPLRDAPPARRAHAGLQQVEVCRYRSELDLLEQWRRLDDASCRASELTVILAFEASLQGNLREVIRRSCPAHRLVIVPQLGHWPGMHSMGDLALGSSKLGWTSIEICRDLGDALKSGLLALGRDDRLLVVLPAGTPVECKSELGVPKRPAEETFPQGLLTKS